MLTLISIFIILSSIGLLLSDHNYKTEYYDQYIDHFNFETFKNQTFKQRYLYNDENFNPNNGVILFYTGNEGDIISFWENTGFMFDVAYLYRGLIIFAEHRFYGKSLPFNDTTQNFKQPALSLLSIDQALADFAYIITHVYAKFKIKSSTPLITFGGSYGGILSAYMRIKYPHLVTGAIASSAPLVGIANFIPRDYFFSHLTHVYQNTLEGCVDSVRSGFTQIEQTLCNSDGLDTENLEIADRNRDKLKEKLRLCSDLNCDSDREQLFSWMRNAFTILAMCNYPYETNFLAKLPPHPVKVSCERLMSDPNEPIEGLYRVMDLAYNGTQDVNKTCFDIYEEYKICADPTGCGHDNDGIAWDYQSCVDMILPSGTNNLSDMFPDLPFTLEARTRYCQQTYGVHLRNHRLALMYGNPLEWGKFNYTNIVLTNGDLDPWMPGGITKNLSKSILSYVIKGGAHHLDLRSANDLDPESVKLVREAEIFNIASWINQTLFFTMPTSLVAKNYHVNDMLGNRVLKNII